MESDAVLESAAPEAAGSGGLPMDLSKRRRAGETIIEAFLVLAGVISIFTTIGIVYVLTTFAGSVNVPEIEVVVTESLAF